MLSTHGQLPWKAVMCYVGGREMMHRLFSASLQLTHLPARTYFAGGTPELDLPSGILRVGGQSSAVKAAQLQMQNLVSYCLAKEP